VAQLLHLEPGIEFRPRLVICQRIHEGLEPEMQNAIR
jgi:hypothetical protein